MAGKHVHFGVSGSGTAAVTANALALPPLHPGNKLDKAQTEGRMVGTGQATGTNPHPNPSPARTAWSNAFLQGFASDGASADLEFHSGVPDKT